MSRVAAGAEYVETITAAAADRRARAAFQQLVLRIAPPGAALYDFGAGPGLDARFYAEHGFTVGAYDADVRMRDYFAAHCRDLIEAGRVSLDAGSYPEFLACEALNGGRPADLVVCNFAPLSLVADLPVLFAKFSALLAPRGAVLASVLSPCYIGDLRYGWWWRHAPTLWRSGRYAVGAPEMPVIRRRLADFAAQCVPHFVLERVYRGMPSGEGPPRGVEFQHRGGFAWLSGFSCRFIFLLFRAAGASS